MNTPVDWSSIARALDVFDIGIPENFLRRWTSYSATESGVLFQAETLGGHPVEFRADVIMPDVIRLRMNPDGIWYGPSDILVSDQWPAPAFSLDEQDNALVLTTGRLRVQWSQFPWQMRVYDLDDAAVPFFSQRIDDRAYGPAYEVAPVGFDELPGGGLAVREAVAVTPGEAFFGFGEKFTSLNKWNQQVVSWAADSGNVTSHRSYKNVPFFMSSAGYGVFVHTSFPILYRMGTESSISYSFHIADSQLDYFLLRGPSFKRILKRYCDLTGYAPVPPKWSLGFWQSRAGYRSQAEVERVVDEMRAREFPCDVISIDPWWMGEAPWSTLAWDREAFPDPEAMLRRLRDQGVRTCLWITPYVPQDTPLYEEGRQAGYFLTDANGQISPVLEAFAGGHLAAVDFTNPAAVTWFQRLLDRLLEMGVAVFKTDFGEQAPANAIYHDGRSGLEMHNLYPLLYNRAVFELTRQRFGRGLTWGRSAYAGSQRYPVQWGGDSYASLDQMSGQLRALLGYGLSGVPFCSHDVGGFDFAPAAFDQGQELNVGEHVSSVSTAILESYPLDPVVYVRWMQFGAFSSHVRAHGKAPHEPWAYGEQAEDIARRYLQLRYRLLPYIYSAAVQASRTGLPVVRPMVLEFQADPTTYHIDTQYMFGDSLLVAPVTSLANRVRVYLPAGSWVDYWTKELRAGGTWIEVEAPLDTLPLWVRAGSIIPLGPDMRHTGEKPLDPLTLEVYYPDSSGKLIVFDEDQPDITVQYARRDGQFALEVAGAPGAVEIVLYGVPGKSARLDGEPVAVREDGPASRITSAAGTFVLTVGSR